MLSKDKRRRRHAPQRMRSYAAAYAARSPAALRIMFAPQMKEKICALYALACHARARQAMRQRCQQRVMRHALPSMLTFVDLLPPILRLLRRHYAASATPPAAATCCPLDAFTIDYVTLPLLMPIAAAAFHVASAAMLMFSRLLILPPLRLPLLSRAARARCRSA